MPPIPSAAEALQHSNRSQEMKNRPKRVTSHHGCILNLISFAEQGSAHNHQGGSGDKHSAATDALMRKPLHFQSLGLPKAVGKQSSRKVMVLQPTTLVCPNFGDEL